MALVDETTRVIFVVQGVCWWNQKDYYRYCYCHHLHLALEIIMGGSVSSGTACWMHLYSICNHYYKPNNTLPCISSCQAHNTFRHMLGNRSVPKLYSLNFPTVKTVVLLHHPQSVHFLCCLQHFHNPLRQVLYSSYCHFHWPFSLINYACA